MNTSDVTACVVDHGLFLPIALKLAEQMKHVYYFSPVESMMPRLCDGMVGDGFDNVTRINSPWEAKGKVDLFVFPDIGFGHLQKELRSQGYPVWGHNGGDILETHRGRQLMMLHTLDMDVPPFEIIHGMANLKSFLMDAEDKYIKISKWRGDWETFHWRSWTEDEGALDQAACHLGPIKEHVVFYVFDAIDTDIEDGVDTYCIDGHWPTLVLHGMERKDKGFLCAVQELDKISKAVTIVNDKFGPVLGEYSYRGFFSSEVRIKDEFSYFIDPTCRAGSPPSQVMCELFDNLGDIIWAGAQGILVDPVPTAQFGVQALLSCKRDKDEWLTLDIPEELDPWVKCGFATRVDDVLRIAPNPLGDMIGWLCATGNTVEESINNLKVLAKGLPCGIDCDISSLASLLHEMEEAKEEGVVLSKDIPEPAVAMEET